MIVLAKIAAIILLLLILIRKKWDLGLILLLDTVLTGILFRMRPLEFVRQAGRALVAGETLNLLGILILVLYLGNFLQAGGHFRQMVDALKNLVKDARLILAIPSAFIGLLPMMAGAMMGAPIVEEAARRWNLSPAWKTFLNYWFRHIWEYSWPLYLNLILAATIIQVPIAKVCLVQAPFTVLAASAGLVILFRRVPYAANVRTNGRRVVDSVKVFSSIWPIFLTIVLIFAFRLPMLAALGIACVLSQALSRFPWRERVEIFRKSVTPRIILLTAAVMIFKRILETSGALEAIGRIVEPHGASGYLLLFGAPFAVGLLTGVNQAFVAISFPLLAPIIGKGQADMVLFLFAYVSGFVGILLSPAHLCLAFTADYFKADLRDIYKILVWPASVVFAAALAVLVVFRII
jgi:integral membrane protein (TIGR00529 family)